MPSSTSRRARHGEAVKIAIVGYGIAASAAAAFLGRSGHEIDCFERGTPESPSGAGLLLGPGSFALLRELGIYDAACGNGARVVRIIADTASGRRLMELRFRVGSDGGFALGIERATLIGLIRRAGSVHSSVRWGQTVLSVDPADGVLSTASGEAFGPYDLVVAADGGGSAMRRASACLIRRDRLYRWAALVSLLEDPSAKFDAAVIQRFSGTQHVSAWPVGRSAEGDGLRISLSLNVPLDRAAAFAAGDEWRDAVARHSPELALLLATPQNANIFPIVYRYRDVVLSRLAVGRVVFIGDAAHSMSPQLGQGVQLALEDASLLAKTVGSVRDVATALATFESERLARIAPLQRACRWTTPFFQSDSRMLAALRDAAMPVVARQPFVRARLRTLIGTA